MTRMKLKCGKAGWVWCASSPDLNDAEHHVAAVKDRSKIDSGFYTIKELKKIAKKNWKDYPLESVLKGMRRMPKLMKRVVELKGGYLLTQEQMRGV